MVREANGTAPTPKSAKSVDAGERVEVVEVDAEHMYTEDSALIGLRVKVGTPWPCLRQ
jgi:hypothetical protein